MANYAKRDARKAWVAGIAGRRDERSGDKPLPVCWCGETAVIEVSMKDGTRYFCEAHRAAGEALFGSKP